MLFKNRENNNENAERTMRIDICGSGGGGGGDAKLESEKKINAAICTLSTAIMPTAGLFAKNIPTRARMDKRLKSSCDV